MIAGKSFFSERTGAQSYGFGGSEKDDEWNGHPGAHYTTDYRQYDPRLGRWTSRDPVVKSWESSYAGFSNNPVYYNDPTGLDYTESTGFKEQSSAKATKTQLCRGDFSSCAL